MFFIHYDSFIALPFSSLFIDTSQHLSIALKELHELKSVTASVGVENVSDESLYARALGDPQEDDHMGLPPQLRQKLQQGPGCHVLGSMSEDDTHLSPSPDL